MRGRWNNGGHGEASSCVEQECQLYVQRTSMVLLTFSAVEGTIKPVEVDGYLLVLGE